jgi:uncharacterized protein DUF4349
MRPRETLTPEQERDLEAIDRTLAGAPVESDRRELEELVRDVRAAAPAMTPAFAARLEQEVADGFPTPREPPARAGGRLRGRRWLLLPALGSLAAVLVALLVVLTDGGDEPTPLMDRPAPSEQAAPPADGGQRDAAPAGARGKMAADQAAGAAAPQAAGPAPSSPARAGPAPSIDPTQAPRKVQRSATLALQTPARAFDRTTDAVNVTVARFGGIVASSQIGASDESGGEAMFDLRIPTVRLDRALAALAELGHVTDRSQGLEDITGSFHSAQERLTDARAERRGLLRALERATTQAQIDSLKAQLRAAASRIGALKGTLASLRRRADLATVSLTVRATGDRPGAGGGGPWTPGDAAGDAVRVLEVLAGVLLIGLAILVPAGLLGGLIALGLRAGRRRRREATLDPA